MSSFMNLEQSSIYALTLNQLQSTMGGGGKDFGSMNMDEFLNNIWTAEEIQATDLQVNKGVADRQGSLTLPRTLSQKTVDEVWRDLHKENGGFEVEGVDLMQPQQKPALSEMTLEQFLQKAGVVEANVKNVRCSEASKPQPKQAAFDFRCSVNNGVPMVMRRSPSDTSPSYAYGEERKRGGTLEKVVERRRKRMIKNRESAARSRARKQAYTLELEAEVAKLKEVNHQLQKKQEEMMESQNYQMPEKMKLWGRRGLCLRRTLTGPW